MDVETIKQKIIEDKTKSTNSYRRYPVRFLFMEMSNHTQEEIQELVKDGNGELLDLSDYLMKKDDEICQFCTLPRKISMNWWSMPPAVSFWTSGPPGAAPVR